MRHRVLLVVLGVGLAAFAGCPGGAPGGTAPTGTATATPTPTGTDTRTAIAETRTPTTERYLTGVAPEDRLVLRAAGNVTVTVTMYEDDTRERRLARERYVLAGGETVRVDEFTPSGYVVLSVDGGRGWAGVVGSADHYEIRVAPGGNATVTRHVVQ